MIDPAGSFVASRLPMAQLLSSPLFGALLCATCVLVSASSKMTSAHLEIRQTWNSQAVARNQHVKIDLQYEQNLTIKVESPFYDDPHLPDMTKNPGSMDKLYNYEVVEVFLLGENDHYLEIELGPRGQYLVLELHGYRNVTRYPIPLPHYQSTITGNRWNASATIPANLLPPKISRINAYAIHGSEANRTYLALYPAPANNPNYTDPDFHRLGLFGPISIFK